MRNGKLHVITGDGKGKTSAGMGMVLRMAGHGKASLVVQFLKDGTSGELQALEHIPECVVMGIAPMRGFYRDMSEEEKNEIREAYHLGALEVQRVCREKRPDFLLLDELAPALALGCVSREDAEGMIDAQLGSGGEAAATGRSAPQWLLDRADYLTECRCLRHPYAAGVDAREGVEW